MKLSDALGREHRFEAPPRRIVSLVPSITETLFAFGLDETIVGATDYCVHPADRLAQVPRVGGTKGLRVEDVLALEPDLVIANREENRRAQIDRLEACGIRVFVTYARTLPEAVREIQALGRLTQCDSAADAIARAVSEALDEVSDLPRLRVLGLIW